MTDDDEAKNGIERSGAATPQLDDKIQSVIGRSLQAHFDDILAAPVPDRFLVLLAELEAKEKAHGG